MKLNNLEFIHISKTGGTSIEEWGEKNNVLWSHKKRNIFDRSFKLKYKNRYSGGNWHLPAKYFLHNPYKNKKTFMVVRNPYTKLVSEYYCKWAGPKDITNHTSEDFNNFIKHFINKKNDTHNIPQNEYLPVDHIIKFENLKEEFDNLISIYEKNIDTTLPHHNKATREKKFTEKDFYSDTIKLINEKYDRDFKIFGYNKIIGT